MHLRNLHLFAIALISISLPCCAQTGAVTFYSIQPRVARQIADQVILSGKAPFVGLLYDGNQLMAHTRGGRFATFLLPVGEHQLSASYRHLSFRSPGASCRISLTQSYNNRAICQCDFGRNRARLYFATIEGRGTALALHDLSFRGTTLQT